MSKIALITPTTLPSRRANTIQVMKMAQGIRAAGREVGLFVPRSTGADWVEPDWAALAAHYGLRERFPIRWLPAHPRWKSYDFGLRSVQAARAEGAGIIFTRHPQAATVASLKNIPTILEVHDFPQGTAGPLLFRAFLRGRGARLLVSISRALLNDLEIHFTIPSKVRRLVAPDGVDLERFSGLPSPEDARKTLNLPAGFTAGYTGHLYAGRGIDHILAVAGALPDVRFLLVGGNPDDVARYRQQAANLPNVQLTGFIPNNQLPLYQAACDILLMPYQHKIEASSGGDIAAYLSPMKLFEYLASERAVLSSDLPVLREILDEQNAILLPANQVDAWVNAISTLRASPTRCRALGVAGREMAARHTWMARAERILSYLG